jgi:hypothetical protein
MRSRAALSSPGIWPKTVVALDDAVLHLNGAADGMVSSLIRLLPNVRQALTSFSMMSIMTLALRPFRLCAEAVQFFCGSPTTMKGAQYFG